MQFKFALLAPLVLALVRATPAPLREYDIGIRSPDVDGHVYMCTDWYWDGLCENVGFTDGQCENVPNDLANQISSVGPDQGWTCNFYAAYNCQGGSIQLTAPGVATLGYPTGEGGFNDAILSFLCFH